MSSDASALSVISIPIASISLYVIAALHLKTHQSQPDRAADNCYYMGFIFTLVSLAYALYQFEPGRQITEFEPGRQITQSESLIHDFGVAIASTIWGMIARLLLNQWRTDPAEIEQEVRQQLSEAARQFRTELLEAGDRSQALPNPPWTRCSRRPWTMLQRNQIEASRRVSASLRNSQSVHSVISAPFTRPTKRM